MKHTNEFLQGMFAAYYGSPVLETHNDGDTITDVIDWEFLSRYKYNDVDGKPILTPLSEITDEDAIEVAKRFKYQVNEQDKLKFLGLELVDSLVKYELDGFMLRDILAITDYLRSKHYDCGYLHIPSLIEAGLAVKSTK